MQTRQQKGEANSYKRLKNSHPKCNMEPISCEEHFKYRRIDGRCNNIINEQWGSSFQPFARLVPADYSDGP